jgi:hypothetical protein
MQLPQQRDAQEAGRCQWRLHVRSGVQQCRRAGGGCCQPAGYHCRQLQRRRVHAAVHQQQQHTPPAGRLAAGGHWVHGRHQGSPGGAAQGRTGPPGSPAGPDLIPCWRAGGRQQRRPAAGGCAPAGQLLQQRHRGRQRRIGDLWQLPGSAVCGGPHLQLHQCSHWHGAAVLCRPLLLCSSQPGQQQQQRCWW